MIDIILLTVKAVQRFGDHSSTSVRTGLGSTSVSADNGGGNITRQLYTAWGETRYSSGSLPTRYTYTGQYSNMADFGLLFYNARWYDPYLNRWTQPDSIIPTEHGSYSALTADYHEINILTQLNRENRKRLENPNAKLPPVPKNPLVFDRYSYTLNNPLKYIDPDGHNPLIIIALIGAMIFFSQIPSDQYQTDPSNWGNPGVQLFGLTLMFAPALGPYICANDGDCANELNATTSIVESVTDKLFRYLLNLDHPTGGSKALWFQKALGFTRENMAGLAKQISFDPTKATPTELTQHGQIYEQIITITGANGRVIDVVFVWIRNLDGTVRLVTAIPTKK